MRTGYAGRYIHFGVREHAMLSILILGTGESWQGMVPAGLV